MGDSIDTSKVFFSAVFKSAFMEFINTGGKYGHPSKFLATVRDTKIRAEEADKMKKIEDEKKEAEKKAISSRRSWGF